MHAQSKKSESFLSTPWASFYMSKGSPQWHTVGGKYVQCLSLSPGTVGQTHLMCCRRALLLYWGRQRRLSCPSPTRLASTCVQADEACSATLAGWLLSWCGGRVFTKIHMPPRRCLASWPRSCTLPRRRWPSWWADCRVGMGTGQRNVGGYGPSLGPT